MIKNEKKLELIANFEHWLIAGDFRFIVKPNGLYEIYNPHTGKKKFQVYVTTEKMHDLDSGDWIVGLESIKDIIDNFIFEV